MNMKTSTNMTMTKWMLLAGVGIALLGQSVSAATTFPQKPLQVGDGGVAPNIMFILDDSGSMQSVSMGRLNANGADISSFPDEVSGYNASPLGDNPDERSYLNNTIYYNPAKTYLPWRTASTTLSDRMPNATISAAVSNTRQASGTPTRDLRNDIDGVFYVPNAGVTASTNPSDFTRYRIVSSSSPNAVDGAVMQRLGPLVTTELLSQNIGNMTDGQNLLYEVAVTNADVAVTLTGTAGDADIRVRDAYDNLLCERTGPTPNESCTVNTTSGTIKIRVRSYSSSTKGVVLRVTSSSQPWIDATPTGRTQAAELQNYANWYQYHRTRVKVAKAGASEAFGTLGSNFRVGFDTIWNRASPSDNTSDCTTCSGDAPAFPIPSGNDGKFSDVTGSANRTNWYAALQGAGAYNGTPLHGALQRAGRYYQTAQPWQDSANGAEIQCRQAYAILTTDGYWNSDTGYNNRSTPAIVDNDGDGNTQTLADVAMAYYNTDLRPALGNKVPTTAGKDENNFQHMVTFGVSIGLKGSMTVTDPPPASNSNLWLDPFRRASGNNANSRLWDNESNRRIDDLWHAAVNSKGSFIVASDSEAFANALRAALQTIQNRLGSSGNLAGNGAELTTGSRVYQATFTSNIWTGDLVSYNISSGGASANTEVWRYSSVANAGAAGYKNGLVLTTYGTAAKEFRLASGTGLTAAEIGPLARSTGNAQVTAVDNLAFLRGDSALEKNGSTGVLRSRTGPVGDIVHSTPIYVPETETLYVGANDGFLHAIRASDGLPLFRYLPKGVDYATLASLSDPDYQHRYFMDGQIDVGARSESINEDKNFLVGAMGRGGKGVFLLDVTNPAPYASPGNLTGMSTSKVLWDNTFQTGGDNDMGYVLGEVLVSRGENDKTLVVVPNGVESVSGRAVLFVYILDANGAVTDTKKFYGGSQTGNGLMSLGFGDLDGDDKLDTVYGGDLMGNLWKWDLSDADPANWKVAFGTNGAPEAMFVAKDAATPTPNLQPITGGIALTRHPSTRKLFVVFGTGRFLSDGTASGIPDDRATTGTQSMYALIDENTATTTKIAGRSELQVRTFPFTGTDSKGRPARAGEAWSALPATKRGWYIDLGVPTASARGERVISRPVVYGRALWFGTLIPQSAGVCDVTGTSGFLNALDVYTGTTPGTAASSYSYINVNGDDDNADRLTGSFTGNSGMLVSVDVGLGGLGTPRITNSSVTVAGMSGGTPESSKTGGQLPGEGAARIMWRELIEGN